MAKLITRYIVPDDFKQYFGIDLNVVLPDDDMPNNKAERFLKQVEDDVALFLATKCNRMIDTMYKDLSDYQKEWYKKALLNQAMYKYKNGDIGNDSGYDPNSGIIADRGKLLGLELSSKCIDCLKLTGLYSRTLIVAPRGFII